MSDQLLRAHEVMAYVYDVANVAYPVSIPDQMNRAYWLVEKAWDLGFFGSLRNSKHRKLLVCGAGAAGVAAAIRAAERGVETVLLESSSAPFYRQRLCRSRWIDPTQYDWSAEHWIAGVYPHAGPLPLPLHWGAARSHHLAMWWQARLTLALATFPHLTLRCPCRATGIPVSVPDPVSGMPSGVRMSFSSGPPEDFGMVLFTTGFGNERTTCPPDYQGFAFWETDPFELPRWGTKTSEQPRAIISGGGDGALQDLIRLATGARSARQVMDRLLASSWQMPPDVRHFLFTAEDQAQRALLWCRPASEDEHRALQTLHDAYVRVVRFLLHEHPDRLKLLKEVRTMLAESPGPVDLVHPCAHFARCYALNHFLAVLLAEVSAFEKPVVKPITLWPVRGVQTVAGKYHVCANNAGLCHGQEHDVQLVHRPHCVNTPGTPPPTAAELLAGEVIVVRHGIAPATGVATAPMAFARQILPYHLP